MLVTGLFIIFSKVVVSALPLAGCRSLALSTACSTSSSFQQFFPEGFQKHSVCLFPYYNRG
jgi:hypothetical protein